ncbi:MarR family winged helix-turn-helix transcriptional regulator [Ramlibacter pallidus]|uniref:MarR family transcriptional regulator n=1 Tax=Ramlibacter pallidus TaxID=2780087 RepID=A0ABR9RZP3_9BURK|nr:MarR family transcriptional regulator [Ramlibacter pallidus]MBE7366304.1 MarR family transcriptional regulator [Ramlibacter pallidus]
MSRASTRKTSAARIDLAEMPGHCIRRLQQVAVALFMEESAAAGVTPVQYAVLQTLTRQPGLDQRSLARAVGFDTSTIGGVLDRLEARGLLTRGLSAQDKRVRLLHLTADGEALVEELTPPMQRTQERILEPLSPAEAREFLRMMQRIIAHHGELGAGGTPAA